MVPPACKMSPNKIVPELGFALALRYTLLLVEAGEDACMAGVSHIVERPEGGGGGHHVDDGLLGLLSAGSPHKGVLLHKLHPVHIVVEHVPGIEGCCLQEAPR